MRPRDAVPACKFVVTHNPSPEGDLAADIFAKPGSIVLAPLDGEVAQVLYLPERTGGKLQGYQIQGYLRLPNSPGKLMPFVAAHLMQGTHPVRGQKFYKGQTIGKIAKWPAHPESAHVHMAFRQPAQMGAGSARPMMPPPANINILRAFELCGPPPKRALRSREVPHLHGEQLHDDLPLGDE